MIDLFPRFAFPAALALLLLVPWAIWLGARIQSLSTGRKRVAITLRTIILCCLIFALAGAELVLIKDELAVFFLLDHSNSVPEETRLAAAQAVRNTVDQYKPKDDQVGIIVFGEDASIELGVGPTLGLGDILSYVGGEQTDLAAAIRLAMAAFPQGYMKRIVVFTDGNETRGTALEEAKLAQAAGVAVEVVPIRTGGQQEVRIREVSSPSQMDADEPFQLKIVAHAEQDSEGILRVFQRVGDERRLLPPQRVRLQQGDNTFILTQEIPNSGFYEYEVTIESESDTVLANNEGRTFTVVQGEPRILYIEGNEQHSQYLEPALIQEGIAVVKRGPESIPSSLAQFQNYDAVILSDVSSTDISSDQLGLIEAMVRDLGIGLIMVGGPNSFGAGGYLDTPVEKALPVDMDIKQRKVLPKGALAVILHTCEFPDGNAWARDIALAALHVLSAQDLMGALGYIGMTGDSWIYELAPVGDKSRMSRILQQASQQIGDMPDVSPTLQMAYGALANTDAAAKRIIMISDGDPAAPQPSLVRQLAAAGIAVSTVCINPHSPADQNMLRNLANQTGGQYYFVTNPRNLPQIFTKEAAVVKRGLMIEEPFQPQPNHDSELLYGLAESAMPQLQGYVVTSPKDTATIPLLSHEGDPVLAHWRYGLGKSVAFTSDVTNRWAAEWLGWDGFRRFWAQTVRWATRELTPTNFDIQTQVRDGKGHIKVDAVDAQGNFINFLRPRGVVTGPGPDFQRQELELTQTGPGIYEADFPLSSTGVYMVNLLYNNADGTQGMIPAGLALGYSPEYEYTTMNLPLLEQIAAAGGGAIMEPAENPFVHDLKATPSVTPIWHWLIIAAVCLFPIEIFVRRVVVPFSVVYAPVAAALRRLPALGNLVPQPKAGPKPVTGAYFAREATQRQFAAQGGSAPMSFGAPAASEPDAPELAAAPADQPVKAPQSDYTKQLLAAKERAIAKKTRRTNDQ